MEDTAVLTTVQAKYELLRPLMDERTRRQWAASEALSLKRGGVTVVAKATGLSRTTIGVGMRELRERTNLGIEDESSIWELPTRVRHPGGGRHPLKANDPTLVRDLEALIGPTTRGDPQSPLRWTCKSTRNLAEALSRRGHRVSHQTVAVLLHDLGYSLQALRKMREGGSHPDRDAQFRYINRQVIAFQERGQPVVSVDTKKKELVGEFKTAGQEWQPEGAPEEVRVYDFKEALPFLRRPVSGDLPRLGVSSPALMRRDFEWSHHRLDHPARQGQSHGRLSRTPRRLDPLRRPTPHRIPTPTVPGRGRHRTLRRQPPTGRTTLRLGTRHPRGGAQRTPLRDAVPGELRRQGSQAQRAEGSATGRGHPRHRRAPRLRRSGTQVGTPVHQPLGRRSARRLEGEGVCRRPVAQRAGDAGHPQPHELPPQADPQGQAAEEDSADRRDLRQRPGGAAAGSGRSRDAGDLHGHEGEGGPGRVRPWGEKPGPTPPVRSRRAGITIRRPRRSWCRWAS